MGILLVNPVVPLYAKHIKSHTRNWAQIRPIHIKIRLISKPPKLHKWPTVVCTACENHWMNLNYIIFSLHLGLFIFLFSLANSGVLLHIVGSVSSLWIKPTIKPASISDSCAFHYTINSCRTLNAAVMHTLGLLFKRNFTYTANMLMVFFIFLHRTGHGDQEHAVPSDRVCQERGNIW